MIYVKEFYEVNKSPILKYILMRCQHKLIYNILTLATFAKLNLDYFSDKYLYACVYSKLYRIVIFSCMENNF